jgi:hypothetical protein
MQINRKYIPSLKMSSVVLGATGRENKTSWPEVVGMSIKEAREIILKDMPNANIQVLPVGSLVTQDFRPDRVRIFVDIVAQTPTVG